MRRNCWEILDCGRAEGPNPCPAATDRSVDGLNGGKAGGRICWALAGTFCGGVRQGTFARKRPTCMSCAVFLEVSGEEAEGFELLPPGPTAAEQLLR